MRSVRPPACPTDSSRHFCPKNSVCHWQKTLTHWVFVMKKNLRPSALLTETSGNFWKIASVLRDWQGHWHASRLFRSRSSGFLCEFMAVRRRCFALCESPSTENWSIATAAFMRLLLVRLHSSGASLWVNNHRRRTREPPGVLIRRLCVKWATYCYS